MSEVAFHPRPHATCLTCGRRCATLEVARAHYRENPGHRAWSIPSPWTVAHGLTLEAVLGASEVRHDLTNAALARHEATGDAGARLAQRLEAAIVGTEWGDDFEAEAKSALAEYREAVEADQDERGS